MFVTLASISQTLGLLALVPVLVYFYMRYKHGYWQRLGIPTAPGGHWFFGHFKDTVLFRKQPGRLVGDLYRATENHDIMGLYFLHKPFLMVRKPELIKHILIKDFMIFPNHHFSTRNDSDKVGSLNLFSTPYPDWKYLRTKLSPVFTSGKIKKLFHLMVETSENMKQHVDNKFVGGTKTNSFRVTDILSKYATDIISSLAFGLKSDSFTEANPEFYTKTNEAFKSSLIRAIRFFAFFFFPQVAKYLGGRMLGTATDYFRKLFWTSMDSREASNTKRGDVIDSLIELKNEEQDTPFKFEGDALLAQSAIFFVAGRETTVTTATFTLWELAKDAELQRRTRREIFDKLDKYGMTYEGVLEMKYLFQVMSETLRMYPPVPILDRLSVADYQIPGTNITIQKGTTVYMPVQGLHSDSKYHPDPLRYDPDRFSDARKAEIEPCSFLPFGEGPRICIASRVGFLQTAVALITILKDYEVTPHDAECLPDPRNVFTTPLKTFTLNFSKLSKTE